MFNYDKGVLAEILEPIMGKGLIPADLETWKPRRRAIVPSFHKAYLEAMVGMFGNCTRNAMEKLDAMTEHGQVRAASPCRGSRCFTPKEANACMRSTLLMPAQSAPERAAMGCCRFINVHSRQVGVPRGLHARRSRLVGLLQASR